MREEDTLVSRLKEIERSVREIKNVQLSGKSNVLVQLVESGSTWDIDTTIDGGTVYNYLFIFTADTQDAPFVSFHPEIRIDGTPYDGTGPMRIDTYLDFAITGGLSGVDFSKSVGFFMTLYDFATTPPFDTYDLKVKMRCLASDRGSITVTAL